MTALGSSRPQAVLELVPDAPLVLGEEVDVAEYGLAEPVGLEQSAPSERARSESPRMAQSDALSGLESEGFDCRAALARMGGNRKLYQRLLGEFLRCHADTVQQLRGLSLSGCAADVRMVAHRLKGVAGNLGLTEVMVQAAQVELSSHDAADLGQALNELELVLGPALAQLKAKLA